MRGISFRISAAVFCALLCGCTEVRVYGQDGVEVHKSIGITEIRLTPSKNPVYVETRGAGLVNGRQHLALGWMKEQAAYFPDPGRCAVLIVASSADDVKAVNTILGLTGHTMADVCVMGGQSDGKSSD